MNEPLNKKYARRVLLAASGLYPQVVTETLYALIKEKKFIPTEIHVLTTARGWDKALAELVDENGHMKALLRQFDLVDRIQFGPENVHVVKDEAGHVLADIKTEKDCLLVANATTDIIRSFCNDENCALHTSIAGGRKTMSHYLSSAMMLFSRLQDQMTHVLVSAPYEFNPNFYYPTQEKQEIVLPDGKTVRACDARISLHYVPVISVRSGVPEVLLQGGSYSSTVEAVRLRYSYPRRLSFDLRRGIVNCSGREIALPPVQLAFFLWMATRRTWPGSEEQCAVCLSADEGLIDEFLQCYRLVTKPYSGDYANTVERFQNNANFASYINPVKARLKNRLYDELGMIASDYEIRSFGKRPFTLLGLRLPPEAIVLPNVRLPKAKFRHFSVDLKERPRLKTWLPE